MCSSVTSTLLLLLAVSVSCDGGGKGAAADDSKEDDDVCCGFCCDGLVNRARTRTVLRLLSPPNTHVHSGGTLTAVCVLSDHPHPPQDIRWRHNGSSLIPQMENVFDPVSLKLDRTSTALLRSASVSTVRGRHATVSRLTLAHVDMSEAGNYTCVPVGIDAQDYHVVADTVAVVVSPQPQDTPDWEKAGGRKRGLGEYSNTVSFTVLSTLAATKTYGMPITWGT